MFLISPLRRFPFWKQCCSWTGLCGSYYDYKTHLINNHQGTLKKQGLLPTSPGRYTACLGHTARSQGKREREREREYGPGVLPLLGSRMGCLGFLRFTLLGIKVWEGKMGSLTQMVSCWGQPGLSKRGTSWLGQTGSLSGCVISSVFVQDECLCSRCLSNRKLNVGHLHFTIKKADSQLLTLHALTTLPSTTPKPWQPLICSPSL